MHAPALTSRDTPRSRRQSARRLARRAACSVTLPLLLGALLRLFFIRHNPDLTGDPLLYGAIARNLLRHGIYGFSATAPTLIRLPGYPLFLAACFRIFGVEHYYPVLYLQLALDLLGCFVLSRLAYQLTRHRTRRTPANGEQTRLPSPERAARATLWLAALCPFTACYTAAPLTETLELLSITTALYAFARTLGIGESAGKPMQAASAQGEQPRRRWGWLALTTLAWIYAALLRPDGALLGLVLCPALVLYAPGRRTLRAAALAALATALAFAPWAARNWHTFHVFQPLAPRYATDPGEPIHPGFQHWTKTVCADLACTAEIYWAADDDALPIDRLPSRAFDSPAQYRETRDLLADYNRDTTLTPALDSRFEALALARAAAHPVRTHLGLPLLRLADMWFRPRVELFNIDLRWWNYTDEGPDTIYAWALAALNALYIALAVAGAVRSRSRPPLLAVFATFLLLRCALLLTLEAPEPRYTLECYPILLVLAGLALAGSLQPKRTSPGQMPQALS